MNAPAAQEGAGAVLLLCTTTRACPEAEAVAFEHARREGAILHVVFVLDPDLLSATASRMAQAGFEVAPGSEGLAQAYRARALDRLAALDARARGEGLGVWTEMREGAFEEETSTLLDEIRPSRVVCARKRRSHYARGIFERGLLDGLRARVALEEVEER